MWGLVQKRVMRDLRKLTLRRVLVKQLPYMEYSHSATEYSPFCRVHLRLHGFLCWPCGAPSQPKCSRNVDLDVQLGASLTSCGLETSMRQKQKRCRHLSNAGHPQPQILSMSCGPRVVALQSYRDPGASPQRSTDLSQVMDALKPR